MSAQLSPSELLAKARWQASRQAPYLSRALWAMTFHLSEVPTLGIDERWRVYYAPDYIRQCHGQGTLVGEILHECLHPTLRHGPRGKAIRAGNARRWNACGDAELDQQIEAMAVKLVESRVRPADLGGLPKQTAEELYQKAPEKEQPCHCAGGSGAGRPMPFEGKGPEGKPLAAGLSEAESQIVRATVAAATIEYAKSRPGRVPSGLLRWAEGFGVPVPLDFRALVAARLAYVLDTRRGSHPTYSRPARRSLPGRLLLPVHRLAVPRVVVVGDTSGSMQEQDLAVILSAVWEACEALGHVSVVACDAEAYELVDVRHLEDLRPHFKGGGGTDMGRGIQAADDGRPDAIVVVTDGLTDWPAEPPTAHVTVLCTQPPERLESYPLPVWADVVFAP